MLRVVNVAGRNVDMKKIRDLYSSMNLKNVRTYIQSGNVLFESTNKELDLDEMRADLELRMAKLFGFEIKGHSEESRSDSYGRKEESLQEQG
jgi:uncharacterized protein (DUF1697 family)